MLFMCRSIEDSLLHMSVVAVGVYVNVKTLRIYFSGLPATYIPLPHGCVPATQACKYAQLRK